MKKLKNYLLFATLASFVFACSGTPKQTWQPKSHAPAHKKYNKKR